MKFNKYSWGKESGLLKHGPLEIDLSENEGNPEFDSISFDTPDGDITLYDENLDLFLQQCADFKAHRDSRKTR